MEKDIGQLVLNRFATYADKIMIKTVNEKSRTFTGKQASDYIKQIAYTLLENGIEQGQRVGIFSSNMPEWTFADLAISAFGGVSVPIFATLNSNDVKYILENAEIGILFVGGQQQYDEISKIIDDKALTLRQVVVFDENVTLTHPKSIHLKNWLQREASQTIKNKFGELAKAIKSEDLATIIYTSGTTGEPKGVMLSHSNIIEAIKNHDLKYDLTDKDISLAFLPFAHIFERKWTLYVFHKGMCNVYNKNPKLIAEAMEKAKPTVMCSVPRLYEKIYFNITAIAEKQNKTKRWLFKKAVNLGNRLEDYRVNAEKPPLELRLKHKLFDRLVLSKIRAKMGGQLRFMPCGGAALSPEIFKFFRAIGLPIVIGYGLTETTATVTSYDVDSYKLGTAGVPLPNVQVKIGDNDEILVKGGGVMKGYYKKPEETAKVFDEHGWFRTGDAGYIDSSGNLVITDRIKDLIKTSGGKYVAPQLVESTLLKHDLIEQVAVIGEGKPFVSALIIPNFEALKAWAAEKGITCKSIQELIDQPRIEEMYQDLVDSLQKKLSSFERVKKFKIMAREFSVEHDEMTPTFKIKRKIISAKYESLIKEMYDITHAKVKRTPES